MTPTNPKTPSLRERITARIKLEYGIHGWTHRNVVDDILLAVKEAMPEKFKGDLPASVGWNLCIEEMEKRCE